MLVKDFIKGPLLEEVKQMTIDNKTTHANHAYLGFILLCSSIEFLGACIDSYGWGDSGLSEKRFRLAIKELFPEKYNQYNDRGNKFDLYSNLRRSLVHSARPGNHIGLSERAHEERANCKVHLIISKDKRLILIFEDFLDDFKRACERVVVKINNKQIQSIKAYEHIIDAQKDNSE